jgi:L-fuculose-phosphate aldolase
MGSASFDPQVAEQAKHSIVTFGRRLVVDRLAVGTAGNLSVRVGDVVAISPSSLSYGAIESQDICLVDFEGTKIEGRGAVSSEWPMHSSIYRSTNAQAIVHTHSPEVVALSTTCSELPAIHYAIAGLGGPVRVVGYTRFGSDFLAEGASTALSSRFAAILQNHGAITYGDTMAQAYDRALLLEWLAEVYRLALQYGPPRILSEEELMEVSKEVARRRYGGLSSQPTQPTQP